MTKAKKTRNFARRRSSLHAEKFPFGWSPSKRLTSVENFRHRVANSHSWSGWAEVYREPRRLEVWNERDVIKFAATRPGNPIMCADGKRVAEIP